MGIVGKMYHKIAYERKGHLDMTKSSKWLYLKLAWHELLVAWTQHAVVMVAMVWRKWVQAPRGHSRTLGTAEASGTRAALGARNAQKLRTTRNAHSWHLSSWNDVHFPTPPKCGTWSLWRSSCICLYLIKSSMTWALVAHSQYICVYVSYV